MSLLGGLSRLHAGPPVGDPAPGATRPSNTYQAPVNQVRTRVVSVPPGDAHQMVTGLPADSSFSDFVSVSEVRGTLCTKHL